MKQIVKHSLLAAAAMMLVACGGGGDNPGSCKFGTSCSNVDGTGVSKVSNTQATQKAMSFSAEDYQLNWGSDGEESSVTIRIADTAGNPLPAGTLIQFSVSGGQIEKTCTTGNATDGSSGCSVSFTTADPRPANGLVAVVAWLVGEESYKDLNGNGKYDQGEPYYESGTLFRDDDASGDFTPGVDEIVVSNTLSGSQIGVGTSACRQDSQAAPSEFPLSVPNTCDGVWGKTLVRAQAYFAVSVPADTGIEPATTNNAGQALSGNNWVRVYTLARDGGQVAAVSDTEITVEPASGTLPANCTLTILPSSTVQNTAVLPTYHRVATSGPSCAGETVIVKATTPTGFAEQVSLTLQ